MLGALDQLKALERVHHYPVGVGAFHDINAASGKNEGGVCYVNVFLHPSDPTPFFATSPRGSIYIPYPARLRPTPAVVATWPHVVRTPNAHFDSQMRLVVTS